SRAPRQDEALPPLDAGEAMSVILRKTTLVPKTAIVLGSGLGIMAEGVAWDRSLATEEVPGLPRSTVPGHSGRLLFGRWSGRNVVVAQGRSHLYEGYSAEEVTRMVRLFAALGAKSLVLTNASGGIAPRMAPGTLMMVEDQVNLQWRAPRLAAIKPSNPRGITSRPVYSADLLVKIGRAAVNAGVRVERGVLG